MFPTGKRMVFEMHANNQRFLVFFAMHLLSGHDWMMDDALCSHMENGLFLGENAWFLKCMQTNPRFLVFFAMSSLTGSLHWAGWHVMSE